MDEAEDRHTTPTSQLFKVVFFMLFYCTICADRHNLNKLVSNSEVCGVTCVLMISFIHDKVSSRGVQPFTSLLISIDLFPTVALSFFLVHHLSI